MHSNKNKYNDGHILTPTERLFYQRMSMDGVKADYRRMLENYKKSTRT